MAHRICLLLLSAALVAACTSDNNPAGAAGAAGGALDHKALPKPNGAAAPIDGIVMPIESKPTQVKGIVMPVDSKPTQTQVRGLLMPPA